LDFVPPRSAAALFRHEPFNAIGDSTMKDGPWKNARSCRIEEVPLDAVRIAAIRDVSGNLDVFPHVGAQARRLQCVGPSPVLSY
jgi:hypothetical protein